MSLLSVCGACADPQPTDLGTARSALAAGNAVRIATRGYVDTPVALSSFWTGAFAITAWINPEFTFNFNGSIFASTAPGASFSLGTGDYRRGPGGLKDSGPPVLALQVGTQTVEYSAPMLSKREWHHLALVRTEEDSADMIDYLVFVDGELLIPLNYQTVIDDNGDPQQILLENVPGPQLRQAVADVVAPAGRLRLGQGDAGQWWGLIDEVRVYQDFFGAGKVWADLTDSGDLPEPLARYDFNARLPILDPTTIVSPSTLVPVDGVSDGHVFDAFPYVSPTDLDYHLPFPAGEIWKVTQGVDDSSGSHNGYAAFCWDFIRDAGTAKTPVIAVADGQIAHLLETDLNAWYVGREANKIRVVHTPNETSGYLHLGYMSVSESLPNHPATQPTEADPATWWPVSDGDQVGTVGPWANHLHFGFKSDPTDDGRTIPGAFTNYWSSIDKAVWTFVPRGMPKRGEYLIW